MSKHQMRALIFAAIGPLVVLAWWHLRRKRGGDE
jgi:hypothetical protein